MEYAKITCIHGPFDNFMSDYVTAMINWFGEKSFILAQSVSVASGGIWSTQVIYAGEFHEFIFKTTIVDKLFQKIVKTITTELHPAPSPPSPPMQCCLWVSGVSVTLQLPKFNIK